MKSFNLDRLVRSNIRRMQPYASARTDFKGEASVWLDANESPYDELGYNRYPDPFQIELKQKLAQIKGVDLTSLFLGNGSDEIIDLLIRLLCEPGKDSILTFTPSYTMYITSAQINDVGVIELPLSENFDICLDSLWKAVDANTKIIFICSPNNPVGRIVPLETIRTICSQFDGLVLVDEAYIDFSESASAISILGEYANLFVLQTLSKAFGMAGLRLGLGFASTDIIELLNRIKPPYNISKPTQELGLKLLQDECARESLITELISSRKELFNKLSKMSLFDKVYPSEGNFILVQTPYYQELYQYLCANGVIVRKRNIPPLLAQGLRFTVGLLEENKQLVNLIMKFEKENI